MSKLIQNAIKTHDGVILKSTYTHDFVVHDCYSLDGGNDYIKITYPDDYKDDYEELFLYDDTPLDILSKKLVWGTSRNGKIVQVKLCDLELDHLENILKTQPLNNLYISTIKYIIDEKKSILRYKKIKKIRKYV